MVIHEENPQRAASPGLAGKLNLKRANPEVNIPKN
jgi:hypothetical protein